MDFPTVNILGFPVARLSMIQVLEQIASAIQNHRQQPGKTLHIVTANAEIIYRAHADQALGQLLLSADLITPDGTGTVRAAQMLGQPVPERVTGIDLMWQLAPLAAKKDWSLYLLGAAEETVAGAVKVLQGKYPTLRIIGWHNGYFNNEAKPAVIQGILDCQPDILFVALGFPGQDRFIREMAATTATGLPAVSIGVGGSFDAINGNVKRAPLWIQRMNLEWAYRIAQNPQRIGRAMALPKFVWAVWRQKKHKKG